MTLKDIRTYLKALALQNSHMAQRPIPLPQLLLLQPNRPLLLILRQRQRKQRVRERGNR